MNKINQETLEKIFKARDKAVKAGLNPKLDFSNKNISKLDFSNADCREANFSRAHCHKANFSGADCRWTNFTGAMCRLVDFANANCYEANFSNADCSKADFTGADCKLANFDRTSCEHSNFTKANIDFASFNLSCDGLLNIKGDERIAKQLMYHTLKVMESAGMDTSKLSEAKQLANESHLVSEHLLPKFDQGENNE